METDYKEKVMKDSSGFVVLSDYVPAVVQEIRKAAAEGKERPYDFIEVMACKGGCVTGGGQPYGHCDELREKRAAALYKDDETHEIRCSHQNPLITQIYDKYF